MEGKRVRAVILAYLLAARMKAGTENEIKIHTNSNILMMP